MPGGRDALGTGVTTVGATIPLYGGIIMDLRRMDQVLDIDGANMHARSSRA